MESTHVHSSGVTPEKLSIMKLTTNELDRDLGSEPTTPIGLRKALDFSNTGSRRSSFSRSSSRHVSRTSRHSSSFIESHRNKMSLELTNKAEGKFLALVDLMASASREASSLKEFWARIVSERQAFAEERESLLIRIDEITETLETKEREHHHHSDELGERKKQVETLIVELTTIRASLAEYKRKIADRDTELEHIRREFEIIRDAESHIRAEYEKYKSEQESLQIKLVAVTDERDQAREDAHRHHSDLRTLTREQTELKSKYSETHAKLESSRKEVLTLNDRIKIWVQERDEWLHEKDKLQEELRKSRNRAEESSRELSELHEKHQRTMRELTKTKEELRSVESERDELTHVLEHKSREIKTKSTGWDEAEERCADLALKYEHIKREVVTTKERLREIEIENSGFQQTIEKRTEEYRVITIERDQLKEDLNEEKTRTADSHRKVSILQESLRRTESTLSEVRSEVYSLTERVKILDRERDEARLKNGHLIGEITELKEKTMELTVEITTITEHRERLRNELQQYKSRFEEIETTVTDYDDSSAELEFEIESLRTLLHDARSDRERAISALTAADRERDDWRNKYEEKCRQLENFEEETAKAYHSSHSHSEGRRTTSTLRRVLSSGTTVHNSNSG